MAFEHRLEGGKKREPHGLLGISVFLAEGTTHTRTQVESKIYVFEEELKKVHCGLRAG